MKYSFFQKYLCFWNPFYIEFYYSETPHQKMLFLQLPPSRYTPDSIPDITGQQKYRLCYFANKFIKKKKKKLQTKHAKDTDTHMDKVKTGGLLKTYRVTHTPLFRLRVTNTNDQFISNIYNYLLGSHLFQFHLWAARLIGHPFLFSSFLL